MTPPRNFAGFTLIELLVVIVVIGILAAIILPVYGTVQQHARSLQCTNNLHELGVAMGLYAADNNGKIPPTSITFPNAFDPYIDRTTVKGTGDSSKDRLHLPGGVEAASQ